MKETTNKVAKVLELQEQGVHVLEIAKKLGYRDQKSLTRFMNKHNFSCKKGIFTPKEVEKNIEITAIERLELQVSKIAKSLNDTQELLKKDEDKKELVIKPRKLNLKATSIRIDEEVANAFDEFCKKYENVQKAYLYTVALEEFMEKYK